MNERNRPSDRAWLREAKTVFLAMIAEIDMTVLNAVNIFFVSRFFLFSFFLLPFDRLSTILFIEQKRGNGS